MPSPASGGRCSSPATRPAPGGAFAALAELGRSRGSTELLARAALGFSADLAGFEVRLFEQRQIDLLEEAARALAGTPMLAWRADVLARLSVALSLSAPSTRRLELAEEAVALARASEDRLALARCLAAHCDAIAGPTHVAERDAEASEIIAIAEAAADGPLELLGRRLRFVARLERGDVDGVEAEVGAFARRAEAVGNPLYSWYVPLWRGQAALTVGDVDAAERLADEAEMLGRAAGSTNGPVLASVLRLMALWQRGEYARAVEMLAALGDIDPELPTYITALGSIAFAHVQAGNSAAARVLLDRTNEPGLAATAEDAEWMGNMVNIVRAAIALDHPILPAALELIEPFADLVVFEGIGAGLYGAMARFVAEGCRAVGRVDDAVRYAERALAVNRALGGVLAADAMRTLASCTAAAGDLARAAALHDEADAAYRGAGVGHLARDADSTRSKRSAGVGRQRMVPRRRRVACHLRRHDHHRQAQQGHGRSRRAAVAARARGARDRAGGRPGGGRSAGAGRRCSTGRQSRRTGSGSATSPPTSTRPTPTTTPVGRREPAPSTTPSSTS